ncbi:hypothetical protein [Pseudomonas capeferrum]
MTSKKYFRVELASNQLKAAICLFIAGQDRFSVITLAGAADVILSRLVLNKGKENFTEVMLRQEANAESRTKTCEEFGLEVNNMLFINQLKHMDSGDDGYIELDPEECALAAILKALANYVTLAGQQEDFVKGFFFWMKLNLDPKKYNVDRDPNWVTPSAKT